MTFAKKLCDVFIDAGTISGICKVRKHATQSNQSTNRSKKYNSNVHKPWFDDECRKSRISYMKMKNKLKKRKSVEDIEKHKVESRRYKKLMKSKSKLYHKELIKKIRSLKNSSPKEYWNIINKSTESKQIISNISTQTFMEHFKKLGIAHQPMVGQGGEFDPRLINHSVNDNLNVHFTTDEIVKLVNKLKNNKACGIDFIRNEFLKYCPKEIISMITELFNLVLDSGLIPSDWCIGIIMPLYKNKGSIHDPDNYRGITLLSCIGKLFTSAINARLTNYLDNIGAIGDEQAGFREGHSTMDHAFTLHSIIDIYLQKRKRVYCAFVDYRKAFDLFNRSYLWQKLIAHGINGNIVNVIYNLYSGAKSCVRSNKKMSDYFPCNIGVRQGDNLSPLLFAIYLNDFEYFVSRRYNGLDSLANDIRDNLSDDDVEVFIRLYVLLYADDTIIMAESAEELQDALNDVYDYCHLWDLIVNTSKTKIVIFSKGRVRKYPEFKFGDSVLEVCDNYTYLGVIFNFNGN